jgi:hypothetical protein
MFEENDAAHAVERVQKNVANRPLTSVALAGILGAGITALVSLGISAYRKHI